MKRLLAVCIVIIGFVFTLTVSANQNATKLECKSELDSDKLYKVVSIHDNKYTTYLNVYPGETLRIYSDNPQYLYIKFYSAAPGEYNITLKRSDDTDFLQTVCIDNNSFLHQLQELEHEADIIEITSNERIRICELELYSKGTLSKDVQNWENSLAASDILVIAAHSDDDTLFFGPLIAENIAKGRLVQTVFISDHPLEEHRINELLDGQWTLGITSYPIIGNFEDHYSTLLKTAESQYDCDEMKKFIVESIRKAQPLVLVTHDLNGEYGHGLHKLVSKLTCEAIELSSDETVYPDSAKEFGTFAPQKTYLHLYEENEIVLDVDTSYDILDKKTPFETAKDAYDCHKSQHKWDLKLTKEGTNDCTRFGLYKSTVEYNSESTDIMNGVAYTLPGILSTSTMPQAQAMLENKPENMFVAKDINTVGSPNKLFDMKTTAPPKTIAVCAFIVFLFIVFIAAEFIKRVRR